MATFGSRVGSLPAAGRPEVRNRQPPGEAGKKIFPKPANVTVSYSFIGFFTFFYFGLRSSDLPTGRQASDPLYYLSLNLPAVGRFRVEPLF